MSIKKIILIILIILFAWAFLRFIIGGFEDGWICDKEKGEWIKHGLPSAPKPTEPCGEVKIENFKECVDAGNSIMESYPRKCSDGDNMYIEDIGNELEKIDIIRINTPRPNQVINSPFVIKGEARGIWFFEGDFPVVLTNVDGIIIAQGFVTAQSEWMTEEFVEFKGTLEFEKPSDSDNGTLILRKDNPSDLPEYDDELEIPILFNP